MTPSPTVRRPAVIPADALPMRPVPGANAACRIPIDRTECGCQNLIQRVFRYETGVSPEMINPASEDVIFVVSGSGEAIVGGQTCALAPSTGLLVPPGTPYHIRNSGPEPLELVSVLSPQPGHEASVPPSPNARPIGKLAVHESEERPLPAGDDRYFKWV